MQETVRLCSVDKERRALFVRKTLTQQWHWTGGKRKPKEELTAALEREVDEETGLLVSKLELIHTEFLPEETIYCYTGVCKSMRWKKPDGKEIDKICRRSLVDSVGIPLTVTQKLLLTNVAIISRFL